MGLRAVLPQLLLALCLLAAGCGTSDSESSSADPSAEGGPSDSSPGDGTSPTCDAECRDERRAEREQREAARCGPLLDGIRLTYRITATPAAGGRAIRLHMILENRSGTRLSGSTAGILRIAPGPQRISWGGSSADELWLGSGATMRREVWHDRKPPGWHPIGDKVTAFGFSTYTYAPGPGTVACFVPATVIAPRGLVDDHPSGGWTQDSTPP